MIRVGDKVIAIAQSDNNFKIIGKIGEVIDVIELDYDGLTHCVDFKTNISRWEMDVNSWWCEVRTLKKIVTNERRQSNG